MFALVDCNNFYASCERLFQPHLNGKPVVVLSNNDGCVIARSNESKALGIKMGAPMFMFEDLFKKEGVHVFSSNYTLYGDISNRVMTTLARFSPELEIYSIDEAFLNLTNMLNIDLQQHAAKMRATVLQHVGIPTGVGVAPSKTLAKSANHYAKKNVAAGVYVIDTEEKRQMVLEWQPVDDVWGIGRRYANWLLEHGIDTAWKLANANKAWIQQKMGVIGLRLVNELNGISCIPMEEMPPAKKEICTSRSFGESLTEKDEVRQSVITHITRCAEKLRTQKSCAGAIQVFLTTNIWNKTQKQYSNSLTVPLLSASNLTDELIYYGMQAFEYIWKPGFKYKKSGVIVADIVPEDKVQQSLFSRRADSERDKKLMQAMDGINARMGRDTLRYASAGYSKRWRLKSERRSNRYTTHIDEILKINN